MDELLKKAINGDQDAFNELYEKSKNYAYITAKLYFKNDDDCYDVLQNAYLKAINKLSQLDNSANFNKWFNRIVENTCKNKLQENNPQLFSDITKEEQEPIVIDERVEFQPEKSQDYQETKRIVLAALNQLPSDQKMCLMMYYYDEYQIKEIATLLGISEATVKSRIKYGKAKMNDYVSAYEKREGIKLHSVAIIPFAMWAMSQQYAKVSAAQISTAATAKAISIPKSVPAGKAVALSLKGKIISGVVAALVVVGGGVGISLSNHSSSSNTTSTTGILKHSDNETGALKTYNYTISDLNIKDDYQETPISFYHKGYLVKVNGKYGYIDVNGKKIVDFKYDNYVKELIAEKDVKRHLNGPYSSVCLSLSGEQYDDKGAQKHDSRYLENLIDVNEDTSDDCYRPDRYNTFPPVDKMYWDTKTNRAVVATFNYEINATQHSDYVNYEHYTVVFADENAENGGSDIRVTKNFFSYPDTDLNHKYHIIGRDNKVLSNVTVSQVLAYRTYNTADVVPVYGLYNKGSAVKDSKSGKWAILSEYGKLLTKFKYDSMEVLDQYTFKFKEGDEIGIIDDTGKILIQGKFENVSKPLINKALVKIDGKWKQIKIDY